MNTTRAGDPVALIIAGLTAGAITVAEGGWYGLLLAPWVASAAVVAAAGIVYFNHYPRG